MNKCGNNMNFKFALLSCALFTALSTTALADQTRFSADPANRHKAAGTRSGKIVPAKSRDTQVAKLNSYAAVPNKKVLVKNVELVGLTSMPPLNIEKLAEDLLGKKVNLKEVHKLADSIGKKYREDGYLLTSTYVPEQSFENGKIKIGVLEGGLRDIKIEGDTDSELFEEYLAKIANLHPLTKNGLTRYLMLMKKLPGYEIDYELVPVEDEAALNKGQVADLYIAVAKTKAQFDANIDNWGTTDLGRTQFALGAELLNGFKKDETLFGFVATTNKPEKLKAGTLGFKKILNAEGTTFGMMASYATNSANVTQTTTTKNDHSTMGRISLSHYPFINNKGNIMLEGGMQHNTQKIYDGSRDFADYRIMAGFVGIDGQYKDSSNAISHATILVDKGVKGPSKVTMFDKTVPAYNDNFTLVSSRIWRDQPLFGVLSAFAEASGQYSSQQLPPERQFIVGGQMNARAYKDAIVSVNKGYALLAELRLDFALNNELIRNVRLYGFYDVAFFSRTQAGTEKGNLASAGGGVRLDLAYDFVFNFEVGSPLTKNTTINSVKTHNPTKYSFMINKLFKI
jgi:hemolysin activation/secretion protein